MFFILEDDQRGKELSQILLKNGHYVSNDFNDLKYADYIYLGLKGIDRKNRIICNNETFILDLTSLKKNSMIFTITFNQYLYENSKKYNYHYYSLIKDNDYLNMNTIMTSEGLISYMIDKCSKPLYMSNILVLGFGMCGKCISKLLKGFDSTITIAVRNAKLEEEIISLGYKYMNLKSLDINNYDYVINTIPAVIIDKNRINNINRSITFFDIASYPFGIDHHEAIKKGFDSYIVSSIPSLYYPQYCANMIYKYIKKKLNNDA